MEIILEENDTRPRGNFSISYLNLWSRIDIDYVSVYIYDFLTDYTYADDGSIWLVGGFGVVHRQLNGDQTLYSLKNDLPHQVFTRVAISPSGEVWIGGTENALYRFDGEEWIDEGVRLPPPRDNTYNGWLCYSKAIKGIDFTSDGSTWVMNGAIEIYAQAYGQWMNFPFPKEYLPIAGGGGCPIGLRVVSEDDITIMRQGCCGGGPTAYHFDGEEWTSGANYYVVEGLLASRHQLDQSNVDYRGTIHESILSDSFDEKYILPEQYHESMIKDYLLTTDTNGNIWTYHFSDLYTNSSGKFEIIEDYGEYSLKEDPDPAKMKIINFRDSIYFYQEGKRMRSLLWFVDELSDFSDSRISSPFYVEDDQIWFYIYDHGLAKVENGQISLGNEMPDELESWTTGGILVLDDGRVWIGDVGSILEYASGQWNKIIILDEDNFIRYLAESDDGIIYAATDTSIYKIEQGQYVRNNFVSQDSKPMVVVDGQWGDCSFHENYVIISNCGRGGIPGFHYGVKYLDVQEDGSVVYINNRIIAKYADGQWKSFLFDEFPIYDGIVDSEGYFWVTTTEGILRLAPEIFNNFQDLH